MKIYLQVIAFIISLLCLHLGLEAQTPRLDLREANKLYQAGQYSTAEQRYRQGMHHRELKQANTFVLGNSLYKQKKYEEAGKLYEQLASDSTLNHKQRAEAYHNLGNVAMQAKKYEEAVKAYKQALINNPSDEETRYNLVLAQKQLKKNNQNNNQNQDNKDNNQDQKQDNNPNQQNQNQQDKSDNKDQEQKKQQNSDNQPQKQSPSDAKMSQKEVEQLLDSYKQSDEETRKRVEMQERAKQQERKQNNRRRW